jgi:hypothetical protein
VGPPPLFRTKNETILSNARPTMRLIWGADLELPKNGEIGMEVCSATMEVMGGLRAAVPGGRLGALHRRGPRQLRLRRREPPNWYVVRYSTEVQLRTGP